MKYNNDFSLEDLEKFLNELTNARKKKQEPYTAVIHCKSRGLIQVDFMSNWWCDSDECDVCSSFKDSLRNLTLKYMEKEFKEGTFVFGRCNVIVSVDAGRWHLSISGNGFSPSYKEIKAARYKYIPNHVTMAQIFPPKEEFVNIHPHCHHLWQINFND